MDMKAWRKAEGLTQDQAAEKLGVSRATLASYESGRRAVPAEVAERLGVTQTAVLPLAPKPPPIIERRADPPPVVREALPRGVVKGARRPTAQEVREHPQRYSGPDVWVTVYDPPMKLDGGQVITRFIQKGSANGQGGYSVHLVGSCSRTNADREALKPGVYRPFRPSLGGPTTDGTGPKGGVKRAA